MSLCTIMIIDDTADHRDMLSRLLRAVGYRVLEASPGEAALNQARGERPDLILTALSLPGQPAWETARLLRDQPALANTPILGASVYNPLLTPARAEALGCADYVDKPFDLDDLLRRIMQLLPGAPALLAA
ncbi:MAG TPA: response regulator [Roseiflexaceae bacterium]|nr:response regulator [Roseiflexaceae bacterium]